MNNIVGINAYPHPSVIAGPNYQTGPVSSAASGKANIAINYNPSDAELNSISFMLGAFETMINYNCFLENNPMRYKLDDILCWNWVIMNVDGFVFPAPIHTASDTESFLFTYSGKEVFLSHEECACTTAIFYLEHFKAMANEWDLLKKKMDPGLILNLMPMVGVLRGMDGVQYENIINQLTSKLSEKGASILN